MRKSEKTYRHAARRNRMPQTRTTTETSVYKIGELYNRAQEYNLYVYDDEGNRILRSFEAFSMLIILMERVLKLFGLSSLEKRKDLSKLYKQRNKRYDTRDAINDVYLLGEISDEEFDNLKEFQKDRNEYIHNIFAKQDEEIEEYACSLFEKHESAFELIIEKLEKSLPT